MGESRASRSFSAMRFAALVARNDLQAISAGVWPRAKFLGLAWCDPSDIGLSTRYFISKKGGYLHSNSELSAESLGKHRNRFIVSGDWDKHTSPIEDVKHISRTLERFKYQRDWASVGEVSWMMDNIDELGVQDGCRNLEDVLARCSAFDALKASLEQGGRLYSRKELSHENFREKGGIGVSISRNGEIIWQTGGAHRLALARLLKLKEIPVCLYRIHSEACSNDAWRKNIYFECGHK